MKRKGRGEMIWKRSKRVERCGREEWVKGKKG